MVVMKVAVVVLFVLLEYTQHGSAQTICTEADSCDECLQRSPDCVWCSQDYFDQTARCFRIEHRGNCSTSNLVMTTGELTNLSNVDVDQDVLVSPQSVRIKLRLGEPQSFNVVVNRIRNAPLDLYFVVDQSFSMKATLATFQQLIEDLFESVEGNITSNLRVGMGLFVDKPLAPYLSMTPAMFQSPCDGCQPAYGFRHIMTLTDDSAEFKRVLSEQIISGNLDGPEGGLDAILQAAVCENIIGWREKSLRMLMHISDNLIHVAGDGSLANVVHPAVLECNLQQNGSYHYYNGTHVYDYPSLSVIRELLSEKLITLVFGVVYNPERELDVVSIIEDLSSSLPRSIVQVLSNSSDNISQVIESAYREITTDITLDVDERDGIDVTFVPSAGCRNNSGGSCLNVEFDQKVTFNVTVTAISCDSDFVRNGTNFRINVPGYGSVEVEFEGICSCECSAVTEENSQMCSDVGTLICGSCVCPNDRDGVNCQCDELNAVTGNCGIGRNGLVCSGPDRGRCQCDRCVCINNFFGDVCECDSFSCERDDNNNICGGPGRGSCGCNGTCTCINGWTRSACDCTPDRSECVDPSALICSNRGTCTCNECICDSKDFTGQFCQICTAIECPEEPACLAYGDCVVCQFGSQGSGSRDCSRMCEIDTLGQALFPNQTFDRGTYMISGSSRTLACLTTEGDCTYRYFVGTSDSDQQPPIVFEGESCTEESEFPAWIIIVIILGALLLLGILILIGIKIFMELRYRYEYQQWLKEKNSAKFGQQLNPIYHKATTDVDNPLYDEKKRQKQKEAEGAASAM